MNIVIKSPQEQKIMKEGGKKLADIKNKLGEKIEIGIKASEIEELAVLLIKQAGGQPSFMTVKNYNWATCVNVGSGIVHGIPKDSIIFQKEDVVSVDVGMYYKGFHIDTSISKYLGFQPQMVKFLTVGQEALDKGISAAVSGNYIYDISYQIETVLKDNHLNPVRSLVGHGVGRELHEDPPIACFTQGKREDTPRIKKGNVFAIEVMYTTGSGEIEVASDGWTILTKDGKISALFEDTVAITDNGHDILTR